MHADPPLRIFATIAPATAASTSAPSSTSNGALPPSSIEEGSARFAVCPSNSLPTYVDPVNDSVATRGSASTASETGPASEVVITFTTPSGAPARCITSATHRAVNGVSAAGLRIVVHPAARAGASLRVAIAAGKFHGVIM